MIVTYPPRNCFSFSYLCEDENMHYILPHSCHSLLGRKIDAVIAHIAYYDKAETKYLTRYMSYTI